jgi:uncharacterized protein YndB with AHSA1/START domain/dihydrofolate reductase
MSELVSYMFISLDGYIADAGGGLEWTPIDDELMRFANEVFSNVDGIVFGRNVYDGFVSYWDHLPSDASAADVEFAAIFKDLDRIVVSSTLDDATGHTVIRDDVAGQIAAAKEHARRDLLLICGPALGPRWPTSADRPLSDVRRARGPQRRRAAVRPDERTHPVATHRDEDVHRRRRDAGLRVRRQRMSYELRLERMFDAPPEAVFDAFVDPENQAELHGSSVEGWTLSRNETDVRVGGTSVYAMGVTGEPPDTETRVFSVVDRPHRLVFAHSMDIAEWGRAVETEMTITFEDRDGKTLLTMVQTGFSTEEDRDSFMTGWPEYLETLRRVVPEPPGRATR